MNNSRKLKELNITDKIESIIIHKEKPSSSSDFLSNLGTTSESITIKNNEILNNYENEIKNLINKISNYNQENKDKAITFECPEENCPFIPFLTYFEFTQSIATKCRFGHEFHLSLKGYYELIFKKINNEKFCNICLTKNYSNIKSSSEFYCINCHTYLCNRCKMIHNNEHQILEIKKVNIVYFMKGQNFLDFAAIVKKIYVFIV